jgi:hypothetical protein
MGRQADTAERKMELADIPGISRKVSPVALGTWAIGGWILAASIPLTRIATIGSLWACTAAPDIEHKETVDERECR